MFISWQTIYGSDLSMDYVQHMEEIYFSFKIYDSDLLWFMIVSQ
jgi:hypothetical protein